jgi:hypothetical protein
MKSRSNKPSGSPKSDRERNDELNKNEGEKKKALPGEYPPQEDIMNRQNMQRVGLDVENFARGVGIENFNKTGEPIVTNPNSIMEEPDLTLLDDIQQPASREMEQPVPKNMKLDDDNFALEEGNESDVTEEDLWGRKI